KSVRIVTPYFIPDQALLVALRTAALRGVAVELMVPARMPNPHEWVVWYAGRSYYEDLLENGVRIYEYLPGFLHGKEIVVDGSWASIGTANMDIRSFRLNFEVNINVYSKDAVAILEENFRKNLKSCREITAAVFAERPVRDRVIENVVRVLSPIL
ncbi:MAG: phospholipase D-like domain-containing protein, partial [Patescibacteria group bacterium]